MWGKWRGQGQDEINGLKKNKIFFKQIRLKSSSRDKVGLLVNENGEEINDVSKKAEIVNLIPLPQKHLQ